MGRAWGVTPPVPSLADVRDVERDLAETQALLRRIVAQADVCLAHLADRERISRRVRSAHVRRRALAAA